MTNKRKTRRRKAKENTRKSGRGTSRTAKRERERGFL